MTRLLEFWTRAATDLEFEIIAPYQLRLDHGEIIDCEFLVKGYGAERGMLVVKAYSSVARHREQIWEAGYGFTVLDEPGPGEEYSRTRYAEILDDWGPTA